MRFNVVRAGDIAEQIRGVSYGKNDAISSSRAGYLPVLRAGNITDEGLIFNDLVFVPEGKVSEKQKIQKGDVVFAASSGSLDVVGKAAPALVDYVGGFGAFCKVMRPNPKQVDHAYFANFFKTTEYRRKISTLAAGANINNLRNEHLDDMLIPLPPLPEQRRIAAILDQADVLIAKRREALAQLDSLTQSIFVEMFGDAQTIFNKWQTKKLGEILDFLTSGSRGWAEYYSDCGALFLRIQNVCRDELRLEDVAFVNAPDSAEAKRTKVQEGDVLLSITADLGRTAVIPAGLGEAHINQHLSILRTSKVMPRYLSAFLTSPAGQREIHGRDKHGVKAGLNFEDIRSFRLPIPPEPLQCEFVQRANFVIKQKITHQLSLAEIECLFTSLQHRAFRGEL